MIRDEEYWAYIRSVVDKAPPLTTAQLSKLTALFDYQPPADRPEKPPGRRKRQPRNGDRRSSKSTPADQPQDTK